MNILSLITIIICVAVMVIAIILIIDPKGKNNKDENINNKEIKENVEEILSDENIIDESNLKNNFEEKKDIVVDNIEENDAIIGDKNLDNKLKEINEYLSKSNDIILGQLNNNKEENK